MNNLAAILPRVEWLRTRITLPETFDYLKLFQQMDREENVFWQNKDRSFTAVGVGCFKAFPVSSPDELATCMDESWFPPGWAGRLYGGFAFDPARDPDPEWTLFGQGYFMVPRVEYLYEHDVWTCVVNSHPAEKLDEIPLPHEQVPAACSESGLPGGGEVTLTAARSAWCAECEQVLRQIREGRLHKAVLACRATAGHQADTPADLCMRMLAAGMQNTYHYMFQRSHDTAFLGASPETLYRRQPEVVLTEALAGTRPRGQNQAEDRALASALEQSSKEQHEHAFVRDYIINQLEKLACGPVSPSPVTVLQWKRSQHLQTSITMEQQTNVSDAELLSALHPTPAVAGVPLQEALEAIRSSESFDRGWYAAPVGWIGADQAEFAVGIRSALIQGSQCTVYGGAGIVKDSDPEMEYDEISLKINSFLDMLR